MHGTTPTYGLNIHMHSAFEHFARHFTHRVPLLRRRHPTHVQTSVAIAATDAATEQDVNVPRAVNAKGYVSHIIRAATLLPRCPSCSAVTLQAAFCARVLDK